MKAFLATLRFLTILPLGRPGPFDPKGMVAHFPLAGLTVGLMLAVADSLLALIWPPMVAAALEAALLAAISGALHLDGLADTADGLYGHREPQTALAIMKDSRVGAMGLVAVVVVLLVKTAALGHIDHARFLALTLVPAYARAAMMVGMRLLPYARGPEGTGSAFFETPLANADFRYLIIPAALSLLLGWRGIVLNLVFALVTTALILLYRRRLGGITGDLLGAMSEIVEAALFTAVCMGAAS